MPATIEDLLNQIKNARYGEQVRSAIHDSIEMCYDDVTASQTVADTAATAATSAATLATNAASTANTAATNADASVTESIARVNSAVATAQTATTNANTARQRAEAAATAWSNLEPQINAAKTDANTATASANSAATSATAAANEWNNTYKSQVTAAVSSANTAASNATAKASAAQSAATDATNAATSATTAAGEWNNTYKGQITTATTNANAAANVISNLTVHSEDVGPNTEASATYRDYDGHKDILIRLRQGQPGEPFRVIGTYATLDDLRENVTSPNIGDMYNVGTSPSFNIYRYTGLESPDDWENNGSIGSASVTNLTTSEIDSIWGGTEPASGTNKYANQTGIYYLAVSKIKAAISGKVDKENKAGTSTPKVLSDNNFSDSYVSTIADHTSRITSVESGKVDKVTGKGLSDNNFTQSYIDAIAANTSGVSSLSTTVGGLQTSVESIQPSAFTVTLSAGSWSNNQQTVTNSAFKASGKAYIVEPVYASISAYKAADIIAKDVETNNQMVFECQSVPSTNITVKVMCIGVS